MCNTSRDIIRYFSTVASEDPVVISASKFVFIYIMWEGARTRANHVICILTDWPVLYMSVSDMIEIDV